MKKTNVRENNYGNTIDRGGLWHVSDAFVEQQSCRYFSVDKQHCGVTEATASLKHILRLYITLRGFAFATSCLEEQNNKALRRELNHPDCC